MKLNEEPCIAFHACHKREIESRSAHLRTPLAIHEDIREKIVIAYRTDGATEYIHTKSMRAAVAQRGIKYLPGRTVLIKNVRAVLRNTTVTSSFLRSSRNEEFYVHCRQDVELPIFKTDSPHLSWSRHFEMRDLNLRNQCLATLSFSLYYYNQKI